MAEMRYVVYGAGAIGGVIGGHLHRSGYPVTLIARGAHLAAIREQGLRLDTPEGIRVVDAPATDTAADVDWARPTVVLVAVKSHQTTAALDDLAAHATPDTVVVSAQNGVANESAILRRFSRTYGINTIVSATFLEPGLIIQRCHPRVGILDIGRFPTGTDEITDVVSRDLSAAGFPSVPRPDIMAWKYRKLIINAQNAIDAICQPGPAVQELTQLAWAEAEAVLAKAGIMVSSAEALQERYDQAGLVPRTDGKPPRGNSTWQSLARGARDVETDYLSGEFVVLGRLHGVPTPVNELICHSTTALLRRDGDACSLDAGELLSLLSGSSQPAHG